MLTTIDTQVSSLFGQLLASNPSSASSSSSIKTLSDQTFFLHQPQRLVFAQGADVKEDHRLIKPMDFEHENDRLHALQTNIDQQIEKQRTILDTVSHGFEDVMIVWSMSFENEFLRIDRSNWTTLLYRIFHFQIWESNHILGNSMAEKLNDFASRLSKGTPKGLGVGVTALFGATAAVYGIYRSMFTGKIIRERKGMIGIPSLLSRRWSSCYHLQSYRWNRSKHDPFRRTAFQVRRLITSLIGDFSETRMFYSRVPWFQYPILYDIRARPRIIKSPTGSKGRQFSVSLLYHLCSFSRSANGYDRFVLVSSFFHITCCSLSF